MQLLSAAIHHPAVRTLDEPAARHEFARFKLMACVTCSIKEPINQVQNDLIWQYINTDCRHLSFYELLQALIFNQAGKLDRRHEHFNLFDLKFFSSVVTDYTIQRARAIRQAHLIGPQQEDDFKPMTPSEGIEALEKKIARGEQLPGAYPWEAIYHEMERRGWIGRTDARKKEIYERLRSQMAIADQTRSLTMDTLQRASTRESFEARLLYACKKEMAVTTLRERNGKD